MKVQTLSLKNFTVFDHAEFEFSPGINVLIGVNGTGKSHVLKAIYALGKGLEHTGRMRNGKPLKDGDSPAIIGFKLNAVFRPDDNDPSRLISARNSEKAAACKLTADRGDVTTTISGGHVLSERHGAAREPQNDFLFVPPREALAMFPGFLHAYQLRELAFDETYHDIALALSGSPLKEPHLRWAREVLAALQEHLPGKVVLKHDKFFVGNLEADLVAEGLRKVAELVQLLRNGSLNMNTVLLWDEPEAGLNPKLVKVIADVMLTLAAKGVQIISATHDYLLTAELSLAAEYRTPLGIAAEPRFFSLSRESPEAATRIERGEVLADLKHNSILDEYAAHYDREHRLFYQPSESSPSRASN